MMNRVRPNGLFKIFKYSTISRSITEHKPIDMLI